jgi:hypothetical protein
VPLRPRHRGPTGSSTCLIMPATATLFTFVERLLGTGQPRDIEHEDVGHGAPDSRKNKGQDAMLAASPLSVSSISRTR